MPELLNDLEFDNLVSFRKRFLSQINLLEIINRCLLIPYSTSKCVALSCVNAINARTGLLLNLSLDPILKFLRYRNCSDCRNYIGSFRL